MPSMLPGFQSGGTPLVSGNPWSGNIAPWGGVQLYNAAYSSGNVYVGLSGGVTITSGGDLTSGGLLDGMEVAPGTSYFVPRLGCSGGMQDVRVAVTAATSGRCRLFWEKF